ncbi:MAG: hypothetical protein SWY16_13775 [Cyanobacteriota bacterium]|nr:hypothetical protein [Cyanobacteriota bacterium]
MTQKDSFICIRPNCTAQNNQSHPFPNYIDWDVPEPKCQCGSNLGWKSANGDAYFLRCSIGSGGGGSVYKACKKTKSGLEEGYALKFFHSRDTSLDKCKKDLEREVQALQNAQKAGARVPKYIDCYFPDTEDKQNQGLNFFLVQNLINGEDMSKVLASKKKRLRKEMYTSKNKKCFNILLTY